MLGCELNVTRALVVHIESEQDAAKSSLRTVLEGEQRTRREGSGCMVLHFLNKAGMTA